MSTRLGNIGKNACTCGSMAYTFFCLQKLKTFVKIILQACEENPFCKQRKEGFHKQYGKIDMLLRAFVQIQGKMQLPSCSS